MTISTEQIEVATAEVEGAVTLGPRPVPKVSMMADNSCYMVFSNVTVPSYRILHIKKNTFTPTSFPEEAILTLQGVDNKSYEVFTGDKYDEVIGKMFK